MHMKYLPIPCVVNNESNFINYVTPPVVSFLVRKDIIYSTIEIQNINCNRIVGTELKGKNINVLPCYIFGVYLPADGGLIFYNECVDKLFDLYSYYSEFGRVIIAGDLNARYKFKPNSYVQEQKSKILTNFIDNTNCIPINQTAKCYGPKYTFEPMQSTLDYILIQESCFDIVTNCIVVDNSDCSIASDHLPIITSINIPTSRHIAKDTKLSPSWHKATDAQLNDYQSRIEAHLNTLA